MAAGFLDGPVLRVTAAPGADLGALAADAEELLEPGNDWSDGLPVAVWELERESWLVMSWTPQPVSSRAEPVGTHPDHRGHGYGRDAVLGACAALADRGASAVAIATPSTNEPAVALYRSAGFTVVRENRDWVRAGRD